MDYFLQSGSNISTRTEVIYLQAIVSHTFVGKIKHLPADFRHSTNPSAVHSAKNFPGMAESTFLSRSFGDQGVRLRIRKESRTILYVYPTVTYINCSQVSASDLHHRLYDMTIVASRISNKLLLPLVQCPSSHPHHLRQTLCENTQPITPSNLANGKEHPFPIPPKHMSGTKQHTRRDPPFSNPNQPTTCTRPKLSPKPLAIPPRQLSPPLPPSRFATTSTKQPPPLRPRTPPASPMPWPLPRYHNSSSSSSSNNNNNNKPHSTKLRPSNNVHHATIHLPPPPMA